MKKIYIRITSIFLLLLFCLTALPLSIFADSVVIEDIETSRIEDDLNRLQAYNNLEGKEYYKDTTVDYCEILDFIEYGYNYWGYTDEYSLYLYLYNPSGKEIDVSSVLKNRIQLRVARVNETVAGGDTEWEKVGLNFLDSTDDFVIYKFKVDVPRSYMPADSQRIYEIADIEITFLNERLRSVGSGGKWIYTGYMDGRGPEGLPLSWSSSNLLTVELELHQASWKTETSAKGPGWQQELSSVYFSVPDHIIKDYGDKNDFTKGLVEVKGVYDNYHLNGFFTNDLELNVLFNSYCGKNSYSNDIPFGFYTDEHIITVTPLKADIDFYFNREKFPIQFNLGTGFTLKNKLDCYYHSFLYYGDILSSSELSEQIYTQIEENKFIKLNGNNGANYNFIVSSDNGDIASQISTISTLNKENYSFWDWLNGVPIYKDESYSGISPIVSVEKGLLSDVNVYDEKKISELYYIDENETSEFRNFVIANENTFLIRFALTDYYCEDIRLCREGAANDVLPGNGNYYFQKDIFLNFDILSLTWENENGVRTVLPVTASPIDIVGSVTPPPLQGIDKFFAGIANIGNNIGETVDLLTSLRPIVWIVGLIAIIAIIALFPGLAKAIWIVISAPFKLIGKAVSGTANFVERRSDKHYERKEQRNKDKRDKRDYDEDVRRYEETKKRDSDRDSEDKRRYEEKKTQDKEDRATDERRYQDSKSAYEKSPRDYKKFK